MATKFSKNDRVALQVTRPEGVVARMRLNEETGAVECLVQWVDNGVEQERWFAESSLELISAAPAQGS